MHEVGLADGILDSVQRRAGDRPVARVRVRIGALHRASPGPMEQAFEMVAIGTVAEGASLELVVLPVISTCRSCAGTVSGEETALTCPRCGKGDLDHAGGDELILESIEYRAPATTTASAAAG